MQTRIDDRQETEGDTTLSRRSLVWTRAGAGSVRIVGEVDVGNLAEFGSAVADLLANPEMDAALEIAELEFMDGSAIRCLLAAAEEIANRGGVLTLHSPGYIVRRALSVLAPEGLLASIRIVP